VGETLIDEGEDRPLPLAMLDRRSFIGQLCLDGAQYAIGDFGLATVLESGEMSRIRLRSRPSSSQPRGQFEPMRSLA
jgi:hypothetical protein